MVGGSYSTVAMMYIDIDYCLRFWFLHRLRMVKKKETSAIDEVAARQIISSPVIDPSHLRLHAAGLSLIPALHKQKKSSSMSIFPLKLEGEKEE